VSDEHIFRNNADLRVRQGHAITYRPLWRIDRLCVQSNLIWIDALRSQIGFQPCPRLLFLKHLLFNFLFSATFSIGSLTFPIGLLL
jgi:hypothetical protein